MGRRPGVTKKNQVGAEGKNDQSVNENPSSIAKDGTTEATAELTGVAATEDGSLQESKSTRRSKRLLKATSPTEDLGIQSEVGTVEIVLDSDAKAEQDLPRNPEVEKKVSDEIERLFKLVEQQQMKIDELAAEKGFPLEDLISVAEIGLKAKANKYKNMYADAERKIQGLQKQMHELTRKLECANAKLEGYEMGQQYMFEVIEKFRDASLFAGLTKTTETTVELPSTGDGANTLKRSAQTKKTKAAKRKKVGDISNLSSETKSQTATKRESSSLKVMGVL